MIPDARIFAAGHRGLVGSGIVRRLQQAGYGNLVLRDRNELDLTRQDAVEAFFSSAKPEFVFLAAARVGGILANETRPAEFLRDNLAIQTNVIDSAYRH
jgi:GDP-L-fucose synthase